MTNYLSLSLEEIHNLLKSKSITPKDLVIEAFSKIDSNSSLNSFITLNRDEALKQAIELEKEEVGDNLFFGIPVAIKDNISTLNLRTTCASKMLENFYPIYDAEVVKKIKDNKMIIIGKTNMDEFAFGSTSRTSYFAPVRNAVNENKIAGGSSGGSAVCVARGLVPFALGSDTGGSIRQPASYNGIVGMKPTYGRISRYGLIAFASSLDSIGPMTRNVYENALFLNKLVGFDEKDLTSANRCEEDFTRKIGMDIKGLRIGVPTYYESDVVDKEILLKFNHVKKLLSDNGAIVENIDIKHIDQAVTLYQIIAMGEASSNLARFDGVRYGYHEAGCKNLDEMFEKTRAYAFGKEVKRRIMVGSYILSGENAKTYYTKALQIREEMKMSFKENFEKYDLIIGPTTTTVAYDIDTKEANANESFMDDCLVIPVNMAGLPAISIPMGKSEENMPIGLHIIASWFDEATIYQLASFIEDKINN